MKNRLVDGGQKKTKKVAREESSKNECKVMLKELSDSLEDLGKDTEKRRRDLERVMELTVFE
jgi:hypothetical protein